MGTILILFKQALLCKTLLTELMLLIVINCLTWLLMH